MSVVGFFKQFITSLMKIIQTMAKEDTIKNAMGMIIDLLNGKTDESAE